MDKTPRHSVSVAAVVLDEAATSVLLVRRRDNNRWEPPGGVLELEETPEEGVRREVLEETGAELAVQGLTGVYKNMPGGIVALVFRCDLLSPPAADSAEAAEVAWIPLSDISELLAPAYAIRVLDALHNSPIEVRAHDGVHLTQIRA